MRRPSGRIALGAALGAAGAAWSLFESQWVELRETTVSVPRLPAELDGFRILHLSDLHLGTLSLGVRALDRAVAWSRDARPDVVVVSGDLVTRRGGKAKLEQALADLDARLGVFAVLGNHDVDDARDPFTRPTDLSDLHEAGAVLLRDDERLLEVDGARVQIVGIDPATYKRRASRPAERAAPDAHLRVLVSHYPDVVRTLAPGVFDLVLAGHLHGGQICLPTPWGKLPLKDMRATYWDGLFETPAGLLHVSRGLGTTFVPFRFLARPDATLLRLTRPV